MVVLVVTGTQLIVSPTAYIVAALAMLSLI